LRDTLWLKFRIILVTVNFYTTEPFIVLPVRRIIDKLDKRPKSYLHFTFKDAEGSSFYPVSGPQTAKTARRHGRKWFGKETQINADGTWTKPGGGEFGAGFWFFSSSSAPLGNELDDPGYMILTENGREKPTIY